MARSYYGLFFDGFGKQVAPTLISRHWTLKGAIKAFDRRNKQLSKWGNAGTFDAVFYVDSEGYINRKRNYALED